MLPWVEHCLWARARGQARCRLLLSHALAVRGRSGRHTGVFPMTKWWQTAVGEGCVHKQIRAHWFGPLFGSHAASLSASASAVASVAGHWVPAKRATTPEPPEAEPRSRTSTCLSLHGDTWNLLLHALHPAVLQRPHLRHARRCAGVPSAKTSVEGQGSTRSLSRQTCADSWFHENNVFTLRAQQLCLQQLVGSKRAKSQGAEFGQCLIDRSALEPPNTL